MEELSPERLGGTCMETDEFRLDGDGIRKLYESEAYPFETQEVPRRRMRRSGGLDAPPVVLGDGDGQ